MGDDTMLTSASRAGASARAAAQRAASPPLAQQLMQATPGLTAADAQALAALAATRSVAASDAVFTQGSATQALVLLSGGTVSVGRGNSASMAPERLLHAPAWLDAASVWVADGRYPLDARALGLPVSVAELPRLAVQALLVQRPVLALRLMAVLAGQVQQLWLQAHELMHKDANGRLAAWLCRHLDGAQAQLHLRERKRDIAAQLGMSAETLSRQMRQLTRQGLIEVRGYHIRIHDHSALQRLAQA